MNTSLFRRLALPFSLAALGALVGCAGGGADPAPEGPSEPAEVAASEGCEDEAWLDDLGITRDQCLAAPAFTIDPNSGEANGCAPGTLIHKAVDPGPPRLVFICKCRQSGKVECFLRN
ncbi:MAG TPA: hypothetical protein VFS43_32350 [Polyangiaceae bacterium]|nr:hypothetical protein [Polyangiaceae bacterium]